MTTVIALLGAECTGKSILATALSQRLAQDTGLRVTAVPEWLRAWCQAHQRTPQRDEQLGIAATQDAWIEAAASSHDVVVADTTSLMTAVFSRFYFQDPTLMEAAVAWHARHVTHTLLLAPDLPWQADGVQRDGAHVQAPVHGLLREALSLNDIAWSLVGGAGSARLEAALDAVAPWVRPLRAPRGGLFSRLQERNREPAARTWRCDRCDDPACEHALRPGPEI